MFQDDHFTHIVNMCERRWSCAFMLESTSETTQLRYIAGKQSKLNTSNEHTDFIEKCALIDTKAFNSRY